MLQIFRSSGDLFIKINSKFFTNCTKVKLNVERPKISTINYSRKMDVTFDELFLFCTP